MSDSQQYPLNDLTKNKEDIIVLHLQKTVKEKPILKIINFK